MIPTTQRELIETLADIHRLSPEIRFGQLLANLGFLVEDHQLREVMEQHRVDLVRCQTDSSVH